MPTVTDKLFAQPVVRRYLEAVRNAHRSIDARGVMQVVREVKLSIDEAFVGMRLRIERPREQFTLSLFGDEFAAADDLIGAARRRPAAERLRDRQPAVVDADALLRHSIRWFVLGDPGSGKTTLLRRMAYQAADNALQSAARPPQLALFLSLRYLGAAWEQHPEWTVADAVLNYLSGPGLDDLIEVNTKAERNAFRAAVRTALAAGCAIVLCDGLDEQRDAKARQDSGSALEHLLHGAPRVPCLITSRTVGFDGASLRGSFAVAHLEPFDEKQTGEFFQRWMLAVERADDPADSGTAAASRAQRRARQLLDQLRGNPGVMALASNPLMCAIIGLIYRQGAVLPELRGELYKLCVDTFVFNWEINKRRAGETGAHLRADETQAVLEAIALDFQRRPRGNAASREELLELAGSFAAEEFGLSATEARERAARLLDMVVNVAGLLVERSPGQFGFFHLTLQEYLAGRAITRRRSEAAAHVAAHWLDPRWREVMLLAAAHQGGKGREEGEEFVELVRTQTHPHNEVMHYSLRLAIECAGETRVGPRMADALLQQWVEAWLAQPALRGALTRAMSHAGARLRSSSEVFERALSQLFGGDANLREQACWAAGAFGDARAVNALLAALRDEEADVRWPAAQALGEIGDARAVDALRAALSDEDGMVLWAAAAALVDIGDARAVDALLEALCGESAGARRAAAGALGNSGDVRAVDALLLTLRDDDVEMRKAATWALFTSGDARAADALLAALRDEDAGARGAAAGVLGHIGDARAGDALLAALRDENADVRTAAAGALANIGDARSVDALLAALRDEDARVRAAAVAAVGHIDETRSVGALLAALRDENAGVRKAAAGALGKIDDARAVEALLAALRDEDAEVREAAADALGNIGDPRAVDGLLAALRGEDVQVRRSAARALGNIGDARAVEALLAALRDRTSVVRRYGADSLEQIARRSLLSDEQLQSLWQLLLAASADGDDAWPVADIIEAADRTRFASASS